MRQVDGLIYVSGPPATPEGKWRVRLYLDGKLTIERLGLSNDSGPIVPGTWLRLLPAGAPLSTELARGPLPLSRAVDILEQMGAALSRARVTEARGDALVPPHCVARR